MKRTNLNFWIDAAAFVQFVFLLSTGVLMRYLLPPGSGRSATMWGLDRHEWGSVHFWVAVAFLATLALHLLLHWKWITSVVAGRKSDASGRRLALGALGLVLGVALAAAPLAATIQRDANATPHDQAHQPGHAPAEQAEQHAHEGPRIEGRMTLAEVHEATGVPIDDLREALGLPGSVRTDDRLGQLKREFGFEMQDVRDAVARFQKVGQ